jgi:membrane-bound lytic murein transglycosylase MltF
MLYGTRQSVDPVKLQSGADRRNRHHSSRVVVAPGLPLLIAVRNVRRRALGYLTTVAVTVGVVLAASTSAISQQRGQPPPASGETVPQMRSQAEDAIRAPWTGDWDGMIKRRLVRLLTPYSRTDYFVDKGVPRGVVYDASLKLEERINGALRTAPATRVHVVVVPVARDELHNALERGEGDIIAVGITITPERRTRVDFTMPVKTNIKEVLVTGPGAPAIGTVEDLAGREVWVRERGNHVESLTALNARFSRERRTPLVIRTLPDALDDDDVLEMVNAGLIRMSVVDDFIVDFWRQVFPNLRVHPSLVLREGGDIAWAVRKNSPKLLAMLNPIVEAHRIGTAWGNVTFRKYLQSTQFVTRATERTENRKFVALVDTFRKYAQKYGLDPLLMMAQGYQESRLDQRATSRVGAIGVMQVMPATARDLKVGDVRQVDANVHAGTKYIRQIIDTHFADEPMVELTKTIFAFAAYNCGPARLRQLRDETARRGLNPNIWFGHVERIVGERVGRETVQYVSNIYKYYLGYLAMPEVRHDTRAEGKGQGAGGRGEAKGLRGGVFRLRPDRLDGVRFEGAIVRDQRRAFCQGLCDQESIEGIGMMRRQGRKRLDMTRRDRKFGEFVRLHEQPERLR